jgi:hypothetical protein
MYRVHLQKPAGRHDAERFQSSLFSGQHLHFATGQLAKPNAGIPRDILAANGIAWTKPSGVIDSQGKRLGVAWTV